MTNLFRSISYFLFFIFSAVAFSAEKIPLLQQQALAPIGLTRVWYHQVRILSGQSKVQHVIFEGGQMFIVTNDAHIHVLNSETGQWLWSRGLGEQRRVLSEPAVNSKVVAVCNGLNLFVFGRKSGKLLYQQELSDVPSAPLQLSENYIYVPFTDETIMAIHLVEIPPEKKEMEKLQKSADAKAKDLGNPELQKIVEEFEDTKRLLKKEEVKPELEEDIIIDDANRIPLKCNAMGTVNSKPTLSRQIIDPVSSFFGEDARQDSVKHFELLSWVVQQGYLYTAGVDRLSDSQLTLRYRVNSSAQTYYLDNTRTYHREMPGHKEMMVSPSVSQPVPANEDLPDRIQIPAIIVTGGKATYIFAVNAQTGNVLWQFPTRGELTEPIAVIGRDVYAPVKSANTRGGLHHFDLLGGAKIENRQVDDKEFWFTSNVSQFVAASKERLYVLDSAKWLVVLDKKTGAELHKYDARAFNKILYNDETDQIFLVTDKGLIQCLREQEFTADGEAAAKKITSLRHRLSNADYAAITLGEKWQGDVPPKPKAEKDEKPAENAGDENVEEKRPAVKPEKKPAERIKLWWEDTLPPSKLKTNVAEPEEQEENSENG